MNGSTKMKAIHVTVLFLAWRYIWIVPLKAEQIDGAEYRRDIDETIERRLESSYPYSTAPDDYPSRERFTDEGKYTSTDYELIDQLSDILENDDEYLAHNSDFKEDDHTKNSDTANRYDDDDKELENEQDEDKKYAIYDDPDYGIEQDKDGKNIIDGDNEQEDDANEEDLKDIEEEDKYLTNDGNFYFNEKDNKETSDEDLNYSQDDENSDSEVQKYDHYDYSHYNNHPEDSEQSTFVIVSPQRNGRSKNDVAEQNSPRWGRRGGFSGGFRRFRRPIRRFRYRRPIRRPIYRRPIRRFRYRRPIRRPIYRRPVRRFTYRRPIRRPIYRRPIRRLTYRRPFRHPRYRRPFRPFKPRLGIRPPGYRRSIRRLRVMRPIRRLKYRRPNQLRRNFLRRIGIRRKNLLTKGGFLRKLRSRFISRLGKYGKQLFRTRPISKIKGYLNKIGINSRKKYRVRNFVKSLKSKIKSLARKSKSFATRFVKGLLKKNKLVPGEKGNGFNWGKFVQGIIEKVAGNGNRGNVDSGGGGGDRNTGNGGDNGNPGITDGGNTQNRNGGNKIDNGSTQVKELNIESIIATMQKTSNKSDNGTIMLKGTTLLSVEFVEQAFENSVMIDTIKRFYSSGMEIFVGQMTDDRIVTLQTQGQGGPKLTVKSPTKTIVIKIIG